MSSETKKMPESPRPMLCNLPIKKGGYDLKDSKGMPQSCQKSWKDLKNMCIDNPTVTLTSRWKYIWGLSHSFWLLEIEFLILGFFLWLTNLHCQQTHYIHRAAWRMSRTVPRHRLNTDPGRLFCNESTDLETGPLLAAVHYSVISGSLLDVSGKFSKARITSIPYLLGPTYWEIKFCRGKEVESTQNFSAPYSHRPKD